MRGRMNGRRTTDVLTLLMFGVFAACILIVLMLGANSYRALVQRDEEAYNRRVATQYIAAKVRHNDREEAVFVAPFSDASPIETLHLRQEFDAGDYVTRIYYYDGYIRELLTAADNPMEPEAGQEIIPAQGMSLALADGLLEITVVNAAGETSAQTVLLRAGEEADR